MIKIVCAREGETWTPEEVKRTKKDSPLTKKKQGTDPIQRPNHKHGLTRKGPDNFNRNGDKVEDDRAEPTRDSDRYDYRRPKDDRYRSKNLHQPNTQDKFKHTLNPDGSRNVGQGYQNELRRGTGKHWEGKTTGPKDSNKDGNLYVGPKKELKRDNNRQYRGIRAKSPHLSTKVTHDPQMFVRTKRSVEKRNQFKDTKCFEDDHRKTRKKGTYRKYPIKLLRVIKTYRGTKTNDQEHT